MDSKTIYCSFAIILKLPFTMRLEKGTKQFPEIKTISCDETKGLIYCVVQLKLNNTLSQVDKKKITNKIWEVLYDDGLRVPPHNVSVSFKK